MVGFLLALSSFSVSPVHAKATHALDAPDTGSSIEARMAALTGALRQREQQLDELFPEDAAYQQSGGEENELQRDHSSESFRVGIGWVQIGADELLSILEGLGDLGIHVVKCWYPHRISLVENVRWYHDVTNGSQLQAREEVSLECHHLTTILWRVW